MKPQYENTHYAPMEGGAPLGCSYDYSLSFATMSM